MSTRRRRERKRRRREKRLKRARRRATTLPREGLPAGRWALERTSDAEGEVLGDTDVLVGPRLPFGPSPFTMERHFRRLRKEIERRGVDSYEGLREVLDGLVGRPLDESLAPEEPDPREEAQELAYRAFETDDPLEEADLALKAAMLDPDCVDALSLLAGFAAESVEERIEGMRRAAEAGERTLGEGFFEENRGNFWGLVETRPYMRAKEALAGLLWRAGREDEAVREYEDMLSLNPGDNQGVRYELLACYLALSRLEDARRLLERYDESVGAPFAWGRVLERFLSGDMDAASAALEEAREANPHVEAYVTGRKPIPRTGPPYYQPGRESEAQCLAGEIVPAWTRHPDAVEWLRKAGGAAA